MINSFHNLGIKTGFKEENSTTIPQTKTMIISHASFELLCSHSRKYHNQPISYDEIIEELCTFYNANHKQKWFLT